MRLFLVCTTLLLTNLGAAAPLTQEASGFREVILATRRNHQLIVFDARSLSELGHFIVSASAESVSASPDGGTLYLRQPPAIRPDSCCALFSLDLATGSLCELIYPSSSAVTTPNGRLLFTQRGNVGVERFDAKSLARLPVIKAPGVYVLYVSPDSRWLFGAQSWVDSSLDVFDIERSQLLRRLQLPEKLSPRGAWLGNRFYLYAHDGKHGNLWQVTPGTTELAAPKKVELPVAGHDGRQVYQQIIGAGDRLIVYEPVGWWLKMDVRSKGAETLRGMFSIDPTTGEFEHLAPATDFTQLIASADGRSLYGIDAGMDEKRPPSLLRVDSATGGILKRRDLARDVWHINVARLPESLIPRGEVSTTLCRNPNAGVRQ